MGLSGFLSRMLKDTLTYWAPSTINEYGDPSFSAPASLTGRMEQKTELFINMRGEESHSKAVIWSTTSMAVGGYLFLGTSTSTNPETVSGADQILHVEAVEDIKGKSTLYKALL